MGSHHSTYSVSKSIARMKIALFLLLCSHCVIRPSTGKIADLYDLWEGGDLPLSSDSKESADNLSSDESSEEGKSIDRKSTDGKHKDDITRTFDMESPLYTNRIMTRCADLCTFQSKLGSDHRDLCTTGCKLQTEAFNSIKERFSKTLPSLLLGSALDRCWEDCAGKYKSPSPSPCTSGCDNMRKIQKKQLANSAREPEQITKGIFSHNLPISKSHSMIDPVFSNVENVKKVEKSKDDLIMDKEDKLEEEGPVQQWTYVLWRPELSLLEDPHQTYSRMVNMMNLLLDSVNVQEEPFERYNPKGWLDDRMQLRIPPLPESRSASLHGEEEENFYNSVAQSLESIKKQVGATISTPGFRQDVYYFLIGLCSLLLLSAAFNSIFMKRETRGQTEDHYYLHGPAITAKLPSYEDCIKADRDLMVGIPAEEIKKTPLTCAALTCQGDSTNGTQDEVKEDKVEKSDTLTGNVV